MGRELLEAIEERFKEEPKIGAIVIECSVLAAIRTKCAAVLACRSTTE